MAFEFIKQDDLYGKYADAKKFMLPLFEPLDEFERIARNKPHPGIAKNLPKVTDGTLAALIQEQPKRVIQQIPTGKVNSDDEWLSIIASWALEHEILPNANSVAALIQKCWAYVGKALTYGSQPAFVQFVNRGDYIGTDFTLPYIKDVFLEPGKLTDKDSNVIFLRTWWTESQLASVINRQNDLIAKSKARKDEQPFESDWDIPKLKKLLTKVGQKEQQAMTPNEREKQLNAGFIEIAHAFQRGVGMNFYSFAPQLGETNNTVRTRKNKDPRGVVPIHYMYTNVDLSNPLGRGAVELSGGMQNLLDSEVQAYQYMRALLMNPPVEKRGDFSKSTIVYAPQAIWDLGSNPNNSVKPVQLTTESLTSFPNNYGLVKSQILNLNSSVDTSISADVGNPGYSKTPAGVRTQEAKLGVSDNYMRKQFESSFEDICETMINLYFAERSGQKVYDLDKDTAEKLRKINPDAVNQQNQVQVSFEGENQTLRFEVDASTSSLKDDAAERDRLVELLDLTQKYPMLGQILGQDGIRELTNRIVVKSGVEDPEKIIPAPDENQVDENGNPIPAQGAPQAPQVTPEMVQQVAQETVMQALQAEKAKDPSQNPTIQLLNALKVKFTDLPEDTQQTVLDQVGFPSNGPTTTAQELAIKKTEAAARVHSTMTGVHTSMMQAAAPEAEDTSEPGEKPEGTQADMGEDQGEGEAPDSQQMDQQLVSELSKRGYNMNQIQQALSMMKQGVSNEQIIQVLHGGLNG